MIIQITIFPNGDSSGITKQYQGDHDELHIKDWNGKVQELLDSVN